MYNRSSRNDEKRNLILELLLSVWVVNKVKFCKKVRVVSGQCDVAFHNYM